MSHYDPTDYEEGRDKRFNEWLKKVKRLRRIVKKKYPEIYELLELEKDKP